MPDILLKSRSGSYERYDNVKEIKLKDAVNEDAYVDFPWTGDATAGSGDIAEGKTAYVQGEKITGTGTPGADQPKLYAPTISVQYDTLTISNPSGNGSFVRGYKIYADGVELGATTATSYTLTNLGVDSGAITVRAYGTNFVDSDLSNSVNWAKTIYVYFYDGATQMVGSPARVPKGSTVANAVAEAGIDTQKHGYDFDGWFSDSTLETPVPASTVLTANATTLYGKWEVSPYLVFIPDDILTPARSYQTAISPNSQLCAGRSNTNTLGVFDISSPNDITLVATYTYTLDFNASYPKIKWISDSLLVVLTRGSSSIDYTLQVLSLSGSTLTDVTSTYLPTITGSGSSFISNVNASGKVVFYNRRNAGGGVYEVVSYIIDTTTTPFTLTDITASWDIIPHCAVLTDDGTIVATKERTGGGYPTHAGLYALYPNASSSVEILGATVYSYGAYYSPDKKVCLIGQGIAREYDITGSSYSLVNTINRAAIRNLDGYHICISTNVIYVLDSNDNEVQRMGIGGASFIDSYSIAADGTRIVNFVSGAPYVGAVLKIQNGGNA